MAASQERHLSAHPLTPPSIPASTSLPSSSSTVKEIDDAYDLVGIGFGPANLALAIALRESQEAQDSNVRFTFVEKQASFGWHSSLLLPGAQLQVSPLKDLATMRDPTSSYTFFNYLHQQGRLAAYINREASVPSRMEWSAYLSWAARRMEEVVEYSQEVVRVEVEQAVDYRIRLFKVTTRDVRDNHFTIRRAKNITVGVGGIPRLPTPFQNQYTSQRLNSAKQIIHSSTYLPSLAALQPMLRQREARRLAGVKPSSPPPSRIKCQWAPLHFAVVGSGQSAAEMCLHLRKTFPNSNVKVLFRASALVPSDDSAFVNAAAFDPERIDIFWKANARERKAWIKEFQRTNYSVVRSDVLNQINNQLYDQRIEFDQPYPNADGHTHSGKLELLPNTEVYKVERFDGDDDDDGMIRLHTSRTKMVDHDEKHSFDAVFLGTGFQRQAKVFDFLEPIAHHYPILDPDSKVTMEQMGFKDEEESHQVISELIASGDEDAVERLRLRCRGIARDYRLIAYLSDAFSHSSNDASSSSSSSPSTAASGASSPRTSVASTGTTLASNKEANIGGESTYEASIFFLGGNEQTHGLADSLLSIVAHRAGELCDSIVTSHSAFAKVEAQAIKSLQTRTQIPSSLEKAPVETFEGKQVNFSSPY
jgi:L-ornithine N5-oxygenase